MSVFYIILFGNFKVRLYVHALKSDRRWALTRNYENAFRFEYPHYAKMAIQAYCHMYKTEKEKFKIMKIIEEDVTDPKPFGEGCNLKDLFAHD